MSKILDKYQIYLYSMKIKVPSIYWILLFFILALLVSGGFFLLDRRIGVLLFVIILDLGIGTPIFKYYKHIEDIERYWPDALRLIADTMKSGSSFDFALREVCSADFGNLSLEVNEVIRRLEMGNTMHVALDYLSLHIDSKIIRRTVTLIQESLRSGAQLADVLEEIANDTKHMFRIKKERKTKTLLQTIFIFTAAGIVAPFIFGMTAVITQFLTSVATSSGIASSGALVTALATQSRIIMLLDIYIVIETMGAAMIISLMRDGKLSGFFMSFPYLISIAYAVYLLAQFAINQMLKGMI